MTKKERVSKILKDIESLSHKMIDEKRTGPFNSFELITIVIQTLIQEKQLDDIERFKKEGNA